MLTTNMGVLVVLSSSCWVAATCTSQTIIFLLDFLSEEISPETEQGQSQNLNNNNQYSHISHQAEG